MRNVRGVENGVISADSNPLGSESIIKLLPRFAVPSIIGMLTGALYNIVDQMFIGKSVGILGVAATNVDLPVTMVAMSAALLFGVGGAANYSLSLGSGNKDRAAKIAGNAVFWMAAFGLLMCVAVKLFLRPVVTALGASDEVLPHSLVYSGTVSWGLPAAVLSTGLSHLIRADGRPGFSMLCTVTGCFVNIGLDALLMFGLGMGVEGAAWATVAAQYVSLLLGVLCLTRFKHTRMTPKLFRPDAGITWAIMSVGAASCVNQLAMSVVQTALNNSLRHYGALSVYGSDIPLAAVGIIMKVNMISLSVVIGVAQGCQPIIGFNYGAGKYRRVRKTFLLAVSLASCIVLAAFACYQLFPEPIIGLFGSDDPMFTDFAVRCFRTFLSLAFLSGVNPVVSGFFASMGKAVMGVFISLTRQILFLLPLVLIFPMIWGIDGVLYAGPVADAATFAAAAALSARELRRMKRLEGG